MAKRTDGGPAHPTNNRMAGEQGASMLDYFAAYAVQSLIIAHQDCKSDSEFAARAFDVARAMVAEREKAQA